MLQLAKRFTRFVALTSLLASLAIVLPTVPASPAALGGTAHAQIVSKAVSHRASHAASHEKSQLGPRVLVVDAHPDDETAYAGSIYKIVHSLHGTVDLAVITNGEAGFKYSTLGGEYYHHDLTNEDTGRKYLPGIREKELKGAGKVLGLEHIYFFHQKDNHYTMNVHEVLDDTSHVWQLAHVRTRLRKILQQGNYDFVLTLLPTDSTHGHHKAATILALEAVSSLPASVERPIVLGASNIRKGGAATRFTGLAGYPLTNVNDGTPAFSFDRGQSFGFRHVLNYDVVLNWVIAEHKSQGTLQPAYAAAIETFYYYDMNPPTGRAKAEALFSKLAQNYYPELNFAPGK